ncbi:uncharacterized protein PAC_11992 [Phialocephala subalpina]|uniref:Uncharacterized protein n=1 Tax=Phialocephala subalpina TaxID=576137 RepID=A0A1L7XAQ4_9HELO|nr:uncharacterized protein PAC_11992 [Phialocephala subalpina]
MPPKRARAVVTPLREVYHYRVHDNPVVTTRTERKSGLTPTYLAENATKAQKQTHDRLESFQRVRFRGFTAAELRSLDSLAPYYEHPDNPLSPHSRLPFHPAFAKDRWQQSLMNHQALFPLGNGRSGYWHVDNAIVWDALEPGVRLASQTLLHAQLWPWWDTLLFGEYRRIPVQDLPIGAQEDQYRLIPRCAEIINNPSEIRRAKTTLNGIACKVEFHLVSEHTDPYTGLERDHLVQGETASQLFGDTIVWFGYELLAPLLDKRITISERMLSCYMARKGKEGLLSKQPGLALSTNEPYLGNDIWTELGFAMETTLFGGLTSRFEFNQPGKHSTRGLPLAGLFQVHMYKDLTEALVKLEESPILGTEPPSDWTEPTFYPVPLPYFFDLHEPGFWNYYLLKNSVTGLHLGPKVLGVKFKGEHPSVPARPSTMHDDDIVDNNPGGKDISDDDMLDTNSPADLVTAIGIENRRRREVRRILDAMSGLQQTPPAPPAGLGVDSNVQSAKKALSVAKFDEIKDFLRRYRRILAMDTLHFNMGAHMLYDHVLSCGLRDISYQQFRVFLVDVNGANTMIRTSKVYDKPPMPTQAMVTFLPDGWEGVDTTTNLPIPPPIERPPYTKPTKFSLDWFERCTARVMDPLQDFCYFHESGLYDFDMEGYQALRKFSNEAFKRIVKEDGLMNAQANPFTVALFRDCICEFENNNYRWALGPPGIVRKLKNGWPQVIDNPPAQGKKRKGAPGDDRQSKKAKKGKP